MKRSIKKNKVKRNKKGGSNKKFNNAVNNVISEVDNNLDYHNCSENNFFSCKNNCKWNWDYSALNYGNCISDIKVDTNGDFVESSHREFKNLEEKILKIKNKLDDLQNMKKHKIESLRSERANIIENLNKLSDSISKLDAGFNQMNSNNITSKQKFGDKHLKLRGEFRELQLKRDNIEMILKMYDN